MSDISKINEIEDEIVLQKMLTATQDFDQRKIIRARLLAIKESKSKDRAKQFKDLESRREEEILERKRRKDEEKLAEMKRFEDMSKTSTSDRYQTFSEKCNQDFIKERAKAAEHEKQKTLEKYEHMAKDHETAKEKDDSVEQKNIQQKLDWANEDKARVLERSKVATTQAKK